MGAVNVIKYGADPSGQTDAIDAFEAARDAVGASGIVYVPAGTYAFSRFLDPKARVFVGENNHTTTHTLLKAMSPMQEIIREDTARVTLKNLRIDATGCDYGTNLVRAHASTLENVDVTGANVAGFYFFETNVARVVQCFSRWNLGRGFHVVGGNGCLFEANTALENDLSGFEIVGVGAAGSGTTFGGLCMIRNTIEMSRNGRNDPSGTSAQIRVRGADSVTIDGCYSESGTAPVVWISDRCTNPQIMNMRAAGGDPYFAYVVEDSINCSFSNCNAAGGVNFSRVAWRSRTYMFGQTVVTPQAPAIFNCRRNSFVAQENLPVVDQGSTDWPWQP